MKNNNQLRKFYPLINRGADIQIVNQKQETCYHGSVRNIPDDFDNCIVWDFTIDANDDIIFVIG